MSQETMQRVGNLVVAVTVSALGLAVTILCLAFTAYIVAHGVRRFRRWRCGE